MTEQAPDPVDPYEDGKEPVDPYERPDSQPPDEANEADHVAQSDPLEEIGSEETVDDPAGAPTTSPSD